MNSPLLLLPSSNLNLLTLSPRRSGTPHSRFGPSSLHQRDPRSALFNNYTGGGGGDQNRRGGAGATDAASAQYNSRLGAGSPAYGAYDSSRRGGGGGGLGGGGGIGGMGGGGGGAGASGSGGVNGGYRPATPNSR